jgi:hypothetical protein
MDIQRLIIRTARPAGGDAARAGATAAPVRGHWEWALVDVGIVLLFVVVPHGVGNGYDGAVRFQALTDLLEGRPVAPNFYSLVGPLFSASLYYLGKAAFDAAWWCAFYNAALLTGGLVALVALLRRVDARTLRTFCLLVVAASMFPTTCATTSEKMFDDPRGHRHRRAVGQPRRALDRSRHRRHERRPRSSACSSSR